MGAIAGRVEKAAGGVALGGQSNLAGALTTHGEAMTETMTDGRRDFKDLLSGPGFTLPLSAGDAGTATTGSATVWGGGAYLELGGEYRDLYREGFTLKWDGDLVGVLVGADVRVRDDLLAGVAVSWSQGDFDFDFEDNANATLTYKGDYAVDLVSAHPYFGWSNGQSDFWASVGYGEGETTTTITQEIDIYEFRARQQYDINLQTVGIGGGGQLWQSGVNQLRLKGEATASEVEVKFEGTQVDFSTNRARVILEASQSRGADSGFEQLLEVGVRYDGGDGEGESGAGAEIGGGLRYVNPDARLTAEGRIRMLLGDSGDYEEWGIEGSVRVSPGADGQGLSFHLTPGYGDSNSGIQELLENGLDETDDNTDATADYHTRLDARLGYGFALRATAGVLTPYSEMTLGTSDRYRVGMNWQSGARYHLNLTGERNERSGDPAEHIVLLKGEVSF